MEENEVFDIRKLLKDEQDLGKVISVLQSGRLTPEPNAEKYNRQLNPKLHDIMDPAKRPDKMVVVDKDSPDYGQTRNIFVNADDSGLGESVTVEHVARIALAYQKLIVKRAAEITFGHPPKYKATPEGDMEKNLYDAVMRVLKDNKEKTLNRKVAKQIYGMTEAAERWYVTEEKDEHRNYSGKGTRFKIRCVVFSPYYGDKLYPFFDDNRKMAAFSRLFSRKDRSGSKTVSYFETYTADAFYLWRMDGEPGAGTSNGWAMCEGYPKPNPFGKIPVVYGCQDEPDYEDAETLIARLEKLLSNFADTNDYHASPKIVVNGHVSSFCKKGEAGAVLELDPGADAKYLAWAQAPESVKQEYSQLKELIHTLTQTPDISWDSVKGMNVSGVALELMFMDAVLKVKDKEEIWMDYLPRRINVIKAMLARIDTSYAEAAKTLAIEPEIVPYIVIDKQQRANIELSLAGNKQLKSRKTAMIDAGIDDPDAELEAIKEEEREDNMFEQGEPTMM